MIYHNYLEVENGVQISFNGALGDTERFVINVTATIDDVSRTETFTVEVSDETDWIPTQLNIDRVLELKVGDTFTVDELDVIPAVEGIQADQVRMQLASYTDFLTETVDGTLHTFTVVKAGTAYPCIQWRYSNINLLDTITLIASEKQEEKPDLILTDKAVLDTYYIWGGWNFIPVVDMCLENWAELSEVYDAPEWSVEITGDTYGMLGTDNPRPDWFWVEVNSVPNVEMDITIKVTCTLGGTTETYTKTLAVREMTDDLRLSLTLPESIEVNAGSTFTLDVSQTDPACSFLTAEHLQFELTNNNDVFEFVSSDGFDYTFKALEPGMYTLQFRWIWQNIALDSLVTVIVRTEDGELPSCEPEYTVTKDLPTIYTGGNATTATMATFTISNLDGLDVLYTLENATWKAESSTHPDYNFILKSLSNAPSWMLWMLDSPETAGTMDVTVTCTLDFADDAHDTVLTFPLTFTIAAAPEGLSAEPYNMGSISVDLGGEFAFDTAEANHRDFFSGIDGSTASWGVDYNSAALSHFRTDGKDRYFRAMQEGVYRITCRWWWKNYAGSSYVTVYVGQDESTESPAFEPTETVYHTQLFTGGNVTPVLIQYELPNSSELHEATGGFTYWEIHTVGDTEGVICISTMGPYSRYYQILLGKVPTQEADITLYVTCEHAGMRKTFITDITITDIGLSDPTVTVPSYLVMQVGVPITIEASDLLDGWEPEGFTPVVEVADDLLEQMSVEGDVYTFKPLKSLVCDGSISWQLGNHDHSGRCLFIIKDENGKLPDGIVDHGVSVEPGETFFVGGTGLEIGGVYIHNTDFMAELTGVELPEWSYEFTGTPAPP